jgi:protoheme IX farnesyltransferase
VIERRLDARMARTRARPLPRGTIDVGHALAFASLLAASGLGLLAATTNALCTALTLASMLGYALVYTVLLKPRTPQNIVIGGAAGAAPPLLGWVAATGSADPGAWVLFLIILVWTPPHFWALAIHRRDDYARAGVPMLPVTHGVEHTSRRIVQYTIALVPLTLFVLPLGSSGALYALGAIALGARFVWWALRLQRDASQARATFRYSIVYLGALFALLLADHWLQQALA